MSGAAGNSGRAGNQHTAHQGTVAHQARASHGGEQSGAALPKASRAISVRRLWRRYGHFGWLLAGVVLALAASMPWHETENPYATQAALEQLTSEVRALQSVAPAARAYAAIRPAVVGVRAAEQEDSEQPSSERAGTGVLISDRGLILTNLHVVQAAARATITFANGLVAPAELVRARPEHDLALLRVQRMPPGLAAASIAPASSLTPGDAVIAVGFPFGIGPSVTAGIVSGLGRQYRFPGADEMATNLIQFDAAVNTGSSGGPLVSMNGEVVGIVTALLSADRDSRFSGVAFAVPIEDAVTAVDAPPF